jgi:hypothetical protein
LDKCPFARDSSHFKEYNLKDQMPNIFENEMIARDSQGSNLLNYSSLSLNNEKLPEFRRSLTPPPDSCFQNQQPPQDISSIQPQQDHIPPESKPKRKNLSEPSVNFGELIKTASQFWEGGCLCVGREPEHGFLFGPKEEDVNLIQDPFKDEKEYTKRRKIKWTYEEDTKLKRLVLQKGSCWTRIAREMPGRNARQVRERYVNCLNPEVEKGKFTNREDKIILEGVRRFGTAWTTIVQHIPGRTAGMIKNRFYSRLKNFIGDMKLIPSPNTKSPKRFLVPESVPLQNVQEQNEEDISPFEEEKNEELLNVLKSTIGIKDNGEEFNLLEMDEEKDISIPHLTKNSGESGLFRNTSNSERKGTDVNIQWLLNAENKEMQKFKERDANAGLQDFDEELTEHYGNKSDLKQHKRMQNDVNIIYDDLNQNDKMEEGSGYYRDGMMIMRERERLGQEQEQVAQVDMEEMYSKWEGRGKGEIYIENQYGTNGMTHGMETSPGMHSVYTTNEYSNASTRAQNYGMNSHMEAQMQIQMQMQMGNADIFVERKNLPMGGMSSMEYYNQIYLNEQAAEEQREQENNQQYQMLQVQEMQLKAALQQLNHHINALSNVHHR